MMTIMMTNLLNAVATISRATSLLDVLPGPCVGCLKNWKIKKTLEHEAPLDNLQKNLIEHKSEISVFIRWNRLQMDEGNELFKVLVTGCRRLQIWKTLVGDDVKVGAGEWCLPTYPDLELLLLCWPLIGCFFWFRLLAAAPCVLEELL
jgi:hypothetical protein